MNNNTTSRSISIRLLHHAVTLSALIVIWTVCLMPVPEVEVGDIPLFDKWVHFVMFGGLGVIAVGERLWHGLKTTKASTLLWGGVMPFVMGGLVELAQATLTTTRSGDVMDWVADGIGALLGWAIGAAMVHYRKSSGSVSRHNR